MNIYNNSSQHTINRAVQCLEETVANQDYKDFALAQLQKTSAKAYGVWINGGKNNYNG